MSALQRPQPRPGVLAIDPYVPGKSKAPGVARVFKLSSNETPLGPSPKAVAAYHAVGEHLQDYPDGDSTALREAIGRTFGLDPSRIVCGAGSDDLLNLIADAYLRDGDEAIHTTHAFLVYPIAIRGSGATPIAAAEKNYTADVDAMLAAVSERTKVVFLANPNNPTGTYVPFDEVRRLHRGLPPHVLLVLDAAYAEYVRRNDYEAGIELVATTDNTVMCRTFSKIHGLAGLRLGWMYGPAHVVEAVNRIRGPFNVNAPAIAAGIAAIEDTAHQETSREHNSRRHGLARTIVATARTPATRKRVVELKLADEVVDSNVQAVKDADLVIVCIPVGACGAVAQEIGPHLKAGAIVSDAGSVKGAVVR